MPPLHGRLQQARSVVDRVEDDVALGAVVEDPEAAADDRPALARQVVDDAEPGRHLEDAPAVHRVVDALAGLVGPVEPLCVGRGLNEPADEATLHRVGGVGRIHADQVAARAGRGAVLADRVVQPRRVGGAPVVRDERGRLERLVPLRRHVVEADAVVDGEPRGRLPVVLAVELEVLVDVLRVRELVGLLVGVEDPGRRVRVAVPRVVGVARVVDEVDRGVEAREVALGLVAVLVVHAELGGVGSPDLGQVREGVKGLVLVHERALVGLVLAGVARASATELEVGDVVPLGGVRVEIRERGESRRRPEQVLGLEIVGERVAGGPHAHLDRRRGVEDAGGREHPVPAGKRVGDRHRELVAAAARPRGAVGLQLDVAVVHVAAGEAPVVRGLEVQPDQVLPPRPVARHLARVVDAAAGREVGQGVDVEGGQAVRIEAVLGDPAEDAAVLRSSRAGRSRCSPGQVRLCGW